MQDIEGLLRKSFQQEITVTVTHNGLTETLRPLKLSSRPGDAAILIAETLNGAVKPISARDIETVELNSDDSLPETITTKEAYVQSKTDPGYPKMRTVRPPEPVGVTPPITKPAETAKVTPPPVQTPEPVSVNTIPIEQITSELVFVEKVSWKRKLATIIVSASVLIGMVAFVNFF